MGLLMPFLLGGFALVGIPWAIHRIRRPTKNTTPFSSLMFVPITTPPVRQRRKIEHPWLMLLRMLVLVLLALAFSRPYTLAPAAARIDGDKTQQHVLLIDTSLSATAPGQFERIKEAARARLNELPTGRIAVVTFNTAPRVIAPFEDPLDLRAGSVDRARAAVDALSPSFGATNFTPALQLAEQLLRPTADSESSPNDDAPDLERIIHLVSDLQRTGLPADSAHYGLARGISLELVPLVAPDTHNIAVEAVSLEARPPDTLYARVRLRNYGNVPVDTTLTWQLDDVVVTEQKLTLLADSSVVVPLFTSVDLSRSARIAMTANAEDALPADNTYFAVYDPAPVRRIGVLIDSLADRAQPIPFLEAAIAETQPVPWRLEPATSESLDATESAPAVLVLPELESVSAETATRIADYVTRGGRLLVLPSRSGFAPSIAEALLRPAGLIASGPHFTEIDPARYALWSWIDYGHPLFQPFRNAIYSDFSMLRFNNYIELAPATDASVQVVARLESDTRSEEFPAIVAFNRDAGRIVVWAFPLDPAWTNIARTRRFVPLLHETIALLLPPLPPSRTHWTEASVVPPAALQAATPFVQVPGNTDLQPYTSHLIITAPGFLRWAADTGGAAPIHEPINIAPAESDLRVFTPEEFLLRIGAVSESVSQAAVAAPQREQNVVHWEYGYPVLILLAVACLLESAVAVYSGRPTPREQQTP